MSKKDPHPLAVRWDTEHQDKDVTWLLETYADDIAIYLDRNGWEDSEVRLLKTSEELRIEIRKDILELQAQGYDPKIIDDDDAPALPTPKRGNGSGNGAG